MHAQPGSCCARCGTSGVCLETEDRTLRGRAGLLACGAGRNFGAAGAACISRPGSSGLCGAAAARNHHHRALDRARAAEPRRAPRVGLRAARRRSRRPGGARDRGRAARTHRAGRPAGAALCRAADAAAIQAAARAGRDGSGRLRSELADVRRVRPCRPDIRRCPGRGPRWRRPPNRRPPNRPPAQQRRPHRRKLHRRPSSRPSNCGAWAARHCSASLRRAQNESAPESGALPPIDPIAPAAGSRSDRIVTPLWPRPPWAGRCRSGSGAASSPRESRARDRRAGARSRGSRP